MASRIKNIDDMKKVASNITSVADYLEVLKYINNYSNRYLHGESKSLFFRGASDASWIDEPSIYRKNKEGKSRIASEHKLYYEIISRCPEYFRHCNTTLEHLVMMQHYGLPTRLLDITENPLVALFFACQKYDKPTDAKVTIYLIPDSEIKNYKSDTAAMLANLARLEKGFSTLFLYCKYILNKLRKLLKSADLYNDDNDDTIFSYFIALNEMFNNHKNNTLEIIVIYNCYKRSLELLNRSNYRPEEYNTIEYDFMNMQKTILSIPNVTKHMKEVTNIGNKISIDKILYFIQEEKSYFDADKMRYKDFENVIVVKTKQDNPNIIKQNGAFLLFGVRQQSLDKTEYAKVPNGYYFSLPSDNRDQIPCIIKPIYKKDILKELQSLSISESYLFPDIGHMANELSEKYYN